MTLNNFIKAVAARLTNLWPDRKVYVDKIPDNADGNFFVGVIESGQQKRLDRRRKRTMQLEVLYFLRADDSMAFNEWAEAMYGAFEALTVEQADGASREIHLTNQAARDGSGDMVFQFTFDADFLFLLTPEDVPSMDNLISTEVLK